MEALIENWEMLKRMKGNHPLFSQAIAVQKLNYWRC